MELKSYNADNTLFLVERIDDFLKMPLTGSHRVLPEMLRKVCQFQSNGLLVYVELLAEVLLIPRIGEAFKPNRAIRLWKEYNTASK